MAVKMYVVTLTAALLTNAFASKCCAQEGKVSAVESPVDSAVESAVESPPALPATADSEQIARTAAIPHLRRDFLEIIRKSNEILAKDSKNAGALIDLGYANRNLGNFADDVTFCTKAIELDPEIAVAYGERAIAYTHLGEKEKALKDFAAAIKIDPQNSAFYSNRGWLYLYENEFQQAIDECTKSIAIYADYSPAYYCRARAYIALHQFEQAIDDLNQAIKLYPNKVIGYYLSRAYIYLTLKDYAKALSDTLTAMRLKPGDKFATMYRMLALFQANNIDALEKGLNDAVAGNPGDANVLVKRATYLRMAEKHQLALNDLDQAEKLTPQDATIYRERALTYKAMNQLDKAAEQIAKAVALIPDEESIALQRQIRAFKQPLLSMRSGSGTMFIADLPSAAQSSDKATAWQNMITMVRLNKIPENIPDAPNFKVFMQRDLEQYFQDPHKKPFTVEYKLLRDVPTLGKNGRPVYFVWLTVHAGKKLVKEGAAILEAENKTAFNITAFMSKSEIAADPNLVARACPLQIAIEIFTRAGVTFEIPPQKVPIERAPA
jgi:tetratricopeptide (TPR) repeat protein